MYPQTAPVQSADWDFRCSILIFFFDPSWTETFNLFCILKLFQLISKLRFSMIISMLIFYLFIFLTNREQKRPASNIKLMLALNQSLACRKRQEKTVCFNILCSDPNRFNEFVYRTLEKFIFFGRPRRRMLKSVSVLPTLELFRILHC